MKNSTTMFSYSIKFAKFLTIVFLAISGFTQLGAQSMAIANVVVQENATHVDVPIHVRLPDSISAIQLSVVWSELKLRLDSLTFSPSFQNENFSIVHNILSNNEVRILVVPSAGNLGILDFEEDLAAFVLSFALLSDFKGSADVRFNPEFRPGFTDYNANHVPTTVTNGTITDLSQTTSNRNLSPSAEAIAVYPNPANNNLRLSGLPDNARNGNAAIVDELGRELWSGKLTNASLAIPEQLPNGRYLLVLKLKDGICSKPVVILR